MARVQPLPPDASADATAAGASSGPAPPSAEAAAHAGSTAAGSAFDADTPTGKEVSGDGSTREDSPGQHGSRQDTSRYSTPGEGSSTLISAVTVVVLLGLWWIASHRRWLPELFLPTPEVVFLRLWESARGELTDAPLATHFGWSLLRVFSAFLLACVTAIPVGIAMGVSRIARGIFDPPIEFYRPLPPLAYLPLIVIWFGIDETSKIILIYLACFAPLAMSSRAGVRSVSQEQIHAAYSMGASKSQVIWHVIIPGAMPEILTAMRISIGFGWTTLVAAEMVAATHGLGQMVLNASNFLRTDIVIMGIVVIGIVAYAFDLLMRWIERLVVPWKGKV